MKKGDYVRLRKNPDAPTGVVIDTIGDYVRIAFQNRSPAKIKKRDVDNFYIVVEPEPGFSLEPEPVKPSRASKSRSSLSRLGRKPTKPRRRKAVKIVDEDDGMDIRKGRVIRVPNQNWGMGVITRIKDDHARIVFLDHYTKLIPIEVVVKYFIPLENSRYIPEELSNPDRWKELHNRNQSKFDPRYDPWDVGMFSGPN